MFQILFPCHLLPSPIPLAARLDACISSKLNNFPWAPRSPLESSSHAVTRLSNLWGWNERLDKPMPHATSSKVIAVQRHSKDVTKPTWPRALKHNFHPTWGFSASWILSFPSFAVPTLLIHIYNILFRPQLLHSDILKSRIFNHQPRPFPPMPHWRSLILARKKLINESRGRIFQLNGMDTTSITHN